ncbi:MAG: acyltransferase family protein [Verrucomicrobiales bacterium]|jgi:peptidoglycan/LPS O-acetylase OafA/YrhL|nr:acyltransferase family protein [Verrucomicrobiales bacterium]
MKGDKEPIRQFNGFHHGEFQETVSHSLQYRPDIDGLRGVAVLAVLVFHLDRAWLPGGFVGVDVFFVISGYLITSIIVRANEAESFSYWRFYQRRIARLFPALLAMVLVTLVVAKGLYTSWDFANTSAAFSASVLSIANFHQWMQGDYFTLSADAQPLMHCWSLSVEEQFYLVFPFLFCGLRRLGDRACVGIIGLVALASFAMSLSWRFEHASSGFYLLPSRAWEMLAGSVLAMIPAARNSDRRWSCFGFMLIFGSFFILHEGPQFPGWQASIPVFGSVLVLRHGNMGLLKWIPLVVVGRASYSLYLWHWPVFSFVDYAGPYQSSETRLLLKLTLTILLTSLSYRYLEKPLRVRLNRTQSRRFTYGILVLALVVLGPLGYTLRKQYYVDGSDGRVFTPKEPTGTIVLMGDSQATMYGVLLRDLAEEAQKRLVVLCQAGKDPLVNGGLWESNFRRIQVERPDSVFLAFHWDKLPQEPSRLAETLECLKPQVGQIILLTMPPDRPDLASRESIRAGARPPFFEQPDKRAFRQRFNELAKEQVAEKVHILDTEPFFVRADGSIRAFDSDGRALYYDRKHLSHLGVSEVKGAVRALFLK